MEHARGAGTDIRGGAATQMGHRGGRLRPHLRGVRGQLCMRRRGRGRGAGRSARCRLPSPADRDSQRTHGAHGVRGGVRSAASLVAN